MVLWNQKKMTTFATKLPQGIRKLPSGGSTIANRLRVYFSESYTHPLKEKHPFPMERYQAVQKTLRERLAQTFDSSQIDVVEPRQLASIKEVQLAHDPNYVSNFINGNLSTQELRTIGFPWTEQFVKRTMAITGATIDAMLDVLVHGHPVSCNAAGGTHHAMYNRGEGYCIFNDLAVCARLAQSWQLVDYVIIIDLDVHQGNGTAQIFAEDPTVFTFSLHGDKNYPWKSRVAGDLDISVPDDISTTAYLDSVNTGLQTVTSKFLAKINPKRTLVLYQAGVDPLTSDRWGRLKMTRDTLQRRNAMVFEWCALHNLPIVTTMGGGYSKPIDEAAQAHVDVFFQAKQFHNLRQITTPDIHIYNTSTSQ